MKAYESAFKAASTSKGHMEGINEEIASTVGRKLGEEEELLIKNGPFLSK
jgi:hypothetical protein